MSDFKLTKLIEKKSNGQVLSDEEIHYFVDSVVKSNKVDEKCRPDRSQIGAMLMAIHLKGLDSSETTALTFRMKDSGYVYTWPEEWKHLVVDKHSTGGVGDKVSLILAPALAALGLKVPMISGRSLSHTGGTLDKLESIPGFRVLLTKEELFDIVESVGCCIAGQTDECVPADKVLYQCREMTATVSCPPLIIASIVSKKLSEGPHALVYDVKYGKGSVFNSKEEALATAEKLVKTSQGVKAVALLTSMDNPLGRTIGNSLEVEEAIDCLQGGGPSDVIELTVALEPRIIPVLYHEGSEVLQQVRNVSEEEGESLMLEVLKNGKALEKFHDMLLRQSVEAEVARELCFGNAATVLSKTRYQTDVYYEGKEGYIKEINPLTLAKVWKEEAFRSEQHPGVGLTLLKVVGDKILTGEAWIRIHHESVDIVEEVRLVKTAVSVDSIQKKNVLIDRRICNTDK